MQTAIDLDAYFRRIGYTGERTTSIATLAAMQARHTRAIAFENLNPFLKRPVCLDTGSLERKLVRDGRGGYCFEHNLLFKSVLASLGFGVAGLAGRVLWGLPEGLTLPRTHMLLKVDVQNIAYVVDVGFGGQTPTGPLRLEVDVEQATPHEPFRLRRDGDGFLMQAKFSDGWATLYRFDLQEQLLPDYEVANWYTSTHPESRFVNNLVAARPAEDRRFALFNNRFSVHPINGNKESRTLTSATALRQTLEDVFGLILPDVPELGDMLERVSRG